MSEVYFSTRYGAALSYLRNALTSNPDLGIIFTALTYPDIATAILSCPCNSYMVDVQPDSMLPMSTQVREVMDNSEEAKFLLVISQMGPLYPASDLQYLSTRFETLWVTNDLFSGTTMGISSLSPLLPTAAVYRGSSDIEQALREHSTNPLGGDYTALTATQHDLLAAAEKAEPDWQSEHLKRFSLVAEYARLAGFEVASDKSATISLRIDNAAAKIETLKAAGYNVGSPVVPLHRLIQSANQEDYPNADKLVSQYVSFPYNEPGFAELIKLLKGGHNERAFRK